MCKDRHCNEHFTFTTDGARYRFILMPPDPESRLFVNVGTLVQGVIVVSVGIYALFVLFSRLFTN